MNDIETLAKNYAEQLTKLLPKHEVKIDNFIYEHGEYPMIIVSSQHYNMYTIGLIQFYEDRATFATSMFNEGEAECQYCDPNFDVLSVINFMLYHEYKNIAHIFILKEEDRKVFEKYERPSDIN